VLCAEAIYQGMNKFSHCVLALAVFIASLEAVSREAEPLEPDCPAVAPCTGPEFVALSPDGPESGIDPAAPVTAQIVETGGMTATGTLPPYVEDTSSPLHHRRPWRPMTQAEDDGWLGATAPSPSSLGWMYETTEIRRPSLARRAAAMQRPDEAWMYAPMQQGASPSSSAI
jgi:hypothetical protein